MFRRLVVKTLAKLALAALALATTQGAARAQDAVAGPVGCSTCASAACAPAHCQRFHCPPVFKWCSEGMPRICFQCGCPKPICNPCQAPNWGYYQKCWSPWPWPPDWSHCPVPPPAAQVFPGMLPAPYTSQVDDSGTRPRLLEVRPPI